MTDLEPLISSIRRAEMTRILHPGPVSDAIDANRLMVVSHFEDEGFETIDLDRFFITPRRQKGFVTVRNEAAFVDYVLQFGPGAHQTVIFANKDEVTAIFNHHSKGGTTPGWSDWGVKLKLQYTPSWTGWRGFAGTYQNQESLANWIEENALDIVEPDAGHLLDIIRNLRLTSQSVVQRRINLANGAVTFYFNEDFQPAGGGDEDAGTITVPPGFTIRTQVFRDGPEFEIPVILRYRVKDGHPEWMFKFTAEAQKIFDDAFDHLCETIHAGTSIPVYPGEPA